MNKLFAVPLLVLALGAAGPALAQPLDIVELIAGIGGGDFQRAAARADSAPAVRVVALSSLPGADAAAGRLDDAEARKRDEIEFLQANLYLNPVAITAIRNAGFAIEQIVTLVSEGDGATILFADDL